MIGTEMVERPLDAGSYVNPLVNTLNGDRYSRETYGTNVVANGYLDIHPIEGLSFRSQFNTHITNASDGSFQANNSATQLYNGTNLSTATESKANSLYTEWNNILTYNFTMLPEGHHLGMTALTTWGRKTYDILSATSYGQTMASNLWWNLASNDGGAGHVVHSSAYTKEQNFSYAFRVNYDWNSRYLFTASIRRDGASRLAEGHKWDTFPSAAIAWRISDEPFNGMFLIHMFWLWLLAPVITPLMHISLAIPCIALATYVCSYVSCKLISLIPGSKWVIG